MTDYNTRIDRLLSGQYRRSRPGAIDDHVLLLQLERAQDALEDRLDKLEDSDEDTCDCDCADHTVAEVRRRIDELTQSLQDAVNLIAEASQRIVDLEDNQNKLLGALERALLQ